MSRPTYQISGQISCETSKLPEIPQTTGVYIFRSSKGSYNYIGKAVNLKARLSSHFQLAKLNRKEELITTESQIIEYIVTDSEFKALVLEASLISKIKPKYNVRWRDDKSYLYIKIKSGEYPTVSMARGQEVQDPKSKYFGPFDSTKSVENLILTLRKIVPFCMQLKLTKAPCFYSKIKLCDPCPSAIDKVADAKIKLKLKRKYKSNIKKISSILNGNIDRVVPQIEKELTLQSKHQNYEQAIVLRTSLRRLKFLQAQGNFKIDEFESYNTSQKAIADLSELFKLILGRQVDVNRIECFDNSTLGFKHNVASMVVYTDGLCDKKQYKRFKLQAHNNDFDMMVEAVMRRARHKDWTAPDILMLDGGKPQLEAVYKALQSDDEASDTFRSTLIIGLAKNPDKIVVNIDGQYAYFKPDNVNLGYRLLQAVRNEAHRFAKKYHTYLRNNELKKILSAST